MSNGYVPLGGVAISPAIYEMLGTALPGGRRTGIRWPLRLPPPSTRWEVEGRGVAARIGAEVIGPGLLNCRQAPQRRRGARRRGVLGSWSWSRTSRPASCCTAGVQPGDELQIAASASRLAVCELQPRIHVVPPCNVSADEVREGLAILTRAGRGGRRAVVRIPPEAPLHSVSGLCTGDSVRRAKAPATQVDMEPMAEVREDRASALFNSVMPRRRLAGVPGSSSQSLSRSCSAPGLNRVGGIPDHRAVRLSGDRHVRPRRQALPDVLLAAPRPPMTVIAARRVISMSCTAPDRVSSCRASDWHRRCWRVPLMPSHW